MFVEIKGLINAPSILYNIKNNLLSKITDPKHHYSGNLQHLSVNKFFQRKRLIDKVVIQMKKNAG